MTAIARQADYSPPIYATRPALRLVTPYYLAEPADFMAPAAMRSSVRLGIILTLQQRALLAWTRTSAFTPDVLHEIPEYVELHEEITDEFRRICISAYVDGVLSTSRRGLPPPVASLSDEALERVETHAARLAAAAVHKIRTVIMPILESVWTPNGTRIKPQPMLEAEVRTVYATFLDTAPAEYRATVTKLARGDSIDEKRDEIIEDSIKRARRRSMKVRNQKQRDKHLATKLPLSKWLKQSTEQILAESKAPPWLRRDLAITWVQTEEQRFHTAGVLETGRLNENIVGYRWVNPFAKSDICKSVHGMVLPKDDPQVSTYQTPLHHGCNTRIQPVYFDEDVIVYTDRAKRPDVSKIAKGFGQIKLGWAWEEAA